MRRGDDVAGGQFSARGSVRVWRLATKSRRYKLGDMYAAIVDEIN
jgi:hypothetical protein